MKFTQNTPIISPNTIGNVQVQAVRDPMAYGMGGKNYEAMAGALGQMAKVAQKQQDDADAADHMSRRNAIMGNITKRLYGEDGLLTNGVGENAKGLTDRVSQVVQEEFERGLEGANNRVRRSMAGTFNENMGNFQRIAGQQEGREFKKVRDNNCVIGIQNETDMAMMNPEDMNLLDNAVNNGLRIADYNSQNNGFSSLQREQARRSVITQIAGGSIAASIEANNFQDADLKLSKYGPLMDQKEVMKYQKQIRGEKQIVDDKAEFEDMYKACLNPDGTINYEKWYAEKERRSKLTKTIGGGGTYFADASLNDEIIAAAEKYKVDPALVAAVADVESNGSQSAVSSVGALGVMQLMPDTAASLGVDPNDRKQNIEGGAKYLRQMLDTFGGDLKKAIAAYNAGPGAVKDYGGVPPYKETQDYVEKILGEGGTYAKYKNVKANGGGQAAVSQAMGMIGQRMDNKGNGCVEAVTKFGNNKDAFLTQEYKNGVVNVDRLAEDAGDRFIPYDASRVVPGTILFYSDQKGELQHVTMADGKGGCIGNSSTYVNENGQKDPQVRHYDDCNSLGANRILTHMILPEGGSGSNSRTVNLHDSGWGDRMERYLQARVAQDKRIKAQQEDQADKTLWNQIQNAGSAEAAIDIYNRILQSGDYQKVQKAGAMVNKRWGGGKNIVGSGYSGSRRTNTQEGQYGKSGKFYKQSQIDEDERIRAVWQNRHDDPHDIISAKEYNEIYDPVFRRINDRENAQYTREIMDAVAQAWEQTQDYDKALKWLKDIHKMTDQEAVKFLDHYLHLGDEEEE